MASQVSQVPLSCTLQRIKMTDYVLGIVTKIFKMGKEEVIKCYGLDVSPQVHVLEI
jgi:DNA-binding protein